ncbi:S8 family serine peptidase [Kutzneria buriramensis]|uniref:Subtilase family protein n=1 Tax=Kutzneria buriramensis TaxID=1045776 RepID=A0A3E0HJ88_9PSEU|nr:S8 family serine peptidase [Kutzneria buriramensis]REH46135.1 subtilase family protein [Kutzneria buriramensis]
MPRLGPGLLASLLALPLLAVPAGAAQDSPQPVIVLMADQSVPSPFGSSLPGSAVRRLGLINGYAATVDIAARSRLASDPRVRAVMPDLPVKVRRPSTPVGSGGPGRASAAEAPPGVCPSDPGKPQLEPEALGLTDAVRAQTLATGKGVKVGFLADGVDVHNPEFTRADGSSVFADYQDFGGDGPNVPTDAAEAFGDASAIAAQGRQSYDLSQFVNPASPLPAGCTIRVRGMAPDASLVGLKVETSDGSANTSTIVQAIDYAVNVDKVDVLNESLGTNPYPDPHNDPFSLANQAAVRAGVTVTTASGDAGVAGTVGDPAGDPAVLSVGASTSLRLFAQTQRNMPGLKGFVSDNVSALSSGGVTEGGQVDDLVAPGNDGWAVCTPDTTRFTGCVNFNGKPSPVITFGGTSQSAPITAGAVALVIQAYRQTHGGSSPSPALVKQILTSTATDHLDPSDQQGTGVLDAYEAVRAAMSIQDGYGRPAAQGDNLLVKQTQLSATAKPGAARQLRLEVTNVGAGTQTVTAANRVLSRTVSDQSGSVTLDVTSPSTPRWTSGSGTTFAFATTTFTVPAGVDHLDATMAFPPNLVNLRLLSPTGQLSAFSAVQGTTGFGHAEVHSPAAGTWTAIFDSSVARKFNGTIKFDFRSSAYAPLGAVSPASLTLAPGRTGTFTVAVATPTSPGDLDAATVLSTPQHRLAVPLTLRSLVTGSFDGVLTGGNGRAGIAAQNVNYRFDVMAGQRDVGIGITLPGAAHDQLTGYLIGPDHQIASRTDNVTAVDDNGRPTAFASSIQSYRRDPQPGRWTFVLELHNPSSGVALTQRFSGQLRLNSLDVQVGAVPATLPAGKPATVAVHVRNTGVATESFFVDPRTSALGDIDLVGDRPAQGLPLPLAGPVAYTVPPGTTSIAGTATSSVPVEADLVADSQLPEALGRPTAKYSATEVQTGTWVLGAATVGPNPSGRTGTVDFSLTAHTQLFDGSVTSSTGDAWLLAVRPEPPALTPLVLAPGQSGTITVTITPKAAPGTLVSGVLYVDDQNAFAFTGDELRAVPYSYLIG